jgi:hypothetical protein
VVYPQAVLLLWDVIQQCANIISDPQFIFGRIIEDVEGDLVADTFSAQELTLGRILFRRSLRRSLMGRPGRNAERNLLD